MVLWICDVHLGHSGTVCCKGGPGDWTDIWQRLNDGCRGGAVEIGKGGHPSVRRENTDFIWRRCFYDSVAQQADDPDKQDYDSIRIELLLRFCILNWELMTHIKDDENYNSYKLIRLPPWLYITMHLARMMIFREGLTQLSKECPLPQFSVIDPPLPSSVFSILTEIHLLPKRFKLMRCSSESWWLSSSKQKLANSTLPPTSTYLPLLTPSWISWNHPSPGSRAGIKMCVLPCCCSSLPSWILYFWIYTPECPETPSTWQ